MKEDMTQNIREDIKNILRYIRQQNWKDGIFSEDEAEERLFDYFYSHHNTTLKEIEDSIEEEKRQIEIQLLGEKDPEVIEYLTGKKNFANDVKQLIHQKLIK